VAPPTGGRGVGGGEWKSFIRHRTLVVGRNARVVWLSFRFLVEERPVRELYQAKVSRNTFPKLIAVVFNWNNGLRRVPRLLALIPGVCALPQNDVEAPSEMLESAKFRLGESPAKLYHIAYRREGGGRTRSRNNYCGEGTTSLLD